MDQVIRLLGRNGIQVNREKAEIILDFLYLIAKTYKTQQVPDSFKEHEPKEWIEHLKPAFLLDFVARHIID